MRTSTRRLILSLGLLGVVAAGCGSDKDDAKTTTPASTTASTAAPTTAAATTAAPTTAAPATTAKPAPTTAKPPATTAAPTTSAAAAITGDINVAAAASLTAAYTDIAAAFEADHPDAHVVLNFGASSDLVSKITTQGLPADVFASADVANMTKLTDAGGNAGEPVVFAKNVLQIIVEPGNPKGIATVADLAQPGLLFVTAAAEVPIAKYTQQVFDKAGVAVTPVSLEADVKGIVTKVTTGEADAGIVYKTDVIAAGDKATGVDIPTDLNVIASYPVVATKSATNAAGAAAFVDFVESEAGQKILRAKGFSAP